MQVTPVAPKVVSPHPVAPAPTPPSPAPAASPPAANAPSSPSATVETEDFGEPESQASSPATAKPRHESTSGSPRGTDASGQRPIGSNRRDTADVPVVVPVIGTPWSGEGVQLVSGNPGPPGDNTFGPRVELPCRGLCGRDLADIWNAVVKSGLNSTCGFDCRYSNEIDSMIHLQGQDPQDPVGLDPFDPMCDYYCSLTALHGAEREYREVRTSTPLSFDDLRASLKEATKLKQKINDLAARTDDLKALKDGVPKTQGDTESDAGASGADAQPVPDAISGGDPNGDDGNGDAPVSEEEGGPADDLLGYVGDLLAGGDGDGGSGGAFKPEENEDELQAS